MIDPRRASEFLAVGRIAVVGATDDPKNFGGTIYRALLDHGIDAEPVHRTETTVAGHPCYPDLASVPGTVDGVLIVVPAPASLEVVRQAGELGISHVWLFKGIGGPGAVSDEVVAYCDAHGMTVVAGACPFMFLEPVKGAHRFHRVLRRLNHSVGKAA